MLTKDGYDKDVWAYAIIIMTLLLGIVISYFAILIGFLIHDYDLVYRGLAICIPTTLLVIMIFIVAQALGGQ